MSSGRVGQAFVLTCFFTAGYGWHRKLGVGFRIAGYGRHRSQWVKNATHVCAAESICSMGVLGFHTFKLALCIHNKLRSHAEILSW